MSYVWLPWQSDRLRYVLVHTGLMVAQKPQVNVENIQTEHGCRFQEERDNTWTYGSLKFVFYCHVVFLLAVTHPESPSVFFFYVQAVTHFLRM